jgi:hypothetical protein
MSKLYQMNRMRYSPAAGGLFTSALKFVGGLFKKKAPAIVAGAAKVAKSPIAQGALGAAGWLGAESLISGGGGAKGGGVSGGFGRPRHRGITYTELKGFRKVARLLHKEGMVSKKARRG